MYAEVSEDFNTKYDTWIIAFCPDTDTFFATNERHFFWESPNEFATEDEAIRNFALNTLYYIFVRNKLMSSMFYGTINVDYKVFLENTKQWYYVSLSSYKTIFRDYQIMRKNRVTCANCIIENCLGKRKCCEQCENCYNEIDFYSMKTLIEKMNTLLSVRYYATTKIENLIRRYLSNMSAKDKHEAEAMPEPFKSQFPVLVAWLAEKMPSEELERKKGKWILTQDEDYEYCTCSECGYQNGENWMNGADIPFCAMCGSYNGGEQSETD